MKKVLFIILIATVANAQLRLVKDINNSGVWSSSGPTSFYKFGGRLFFTVQPLDNVNDRSIQVTDGTTNGTKQIKFGTNTGPLAYSYFVSAYFYEYNSELFFEAENTPFGDVYIAKLTGTSNLATYVKNFSLLSGTPNTRFANATGLNNKLVFSPFAANDVEPYVVDLTNPANSGLLLNINTTGNSNPNNFKIFDDACFFSATKSTTGNELWKTNGTSAGTSLYSDINVGAANSNPDQLNVIGNNLTFVATTSNYGRELFKTDGSGTIQLIKDINTTTATANSNPDKVTKIGDKLYFRANDGVRGLEPWVSDGTIQGTFLLKDINTASGTTSHSNPYGFTLVGATVYFFTSYSNFVDLWKTDGTSAGTEFVIRLTGAKSVSQALEYNGLLYFIINYTSTGNRLWASNGTADLTFQIPNVVPNEMILYNNELFMGAQDLTSTLGQELYAYRDSTLAKNEFSLIENELTIFPNPSKNYFELTTELAIKKVEIYSMLGQLVKTFDKQNQYAISDIATGSYIVKIKTSEGTSNKTLLID